MILINLALLFCLVTFSQMTYTKGESYTCATHPIYLQAKQFLLSTVDGSSEATRQMQSLIDSFATNTPTSRTAADLGVCSQFAGELTCCTKQMVDLFDKAALQSVAHIQSNGTGIKKLINLIKKALLANKCGSDLDRLTVEDVLKNKTFTQLQAALTASQAAKQGFSKAISALNRGALCSVCAGTDKIANYFSSPNVLVDKSNNDQFVAALTTSFDELRTAFNERQDGIFNITKEVGGFYKANCAKNWEQITYDIMTMFGRSNTNSNDSFNNPKCNGQVIFNKRPICDAAQDGDSAVDAAGDAYKGIVPKRQRLLTTVVDIKDALIADAGGLKVFNPQSSDDQITADGNYSITWPIDSSSNNNNNNSNNSTTSQARIFFSGIVLFMIALTF